MLSVCTSHTCYDQVGQLSHGHIDRRTPRTKERGRGNATYTQKDLCQTEKEKPRIWKGCGIVYSVISLPFQVKKQPCFYSVTMVASQSFETDRFFTTIPFKCFPSLFLTIFRIAAEKILEAIDLYLCNCVINAKFIPAAIARHPYTDTISARH